MKEIIISIHSITDTITNSSSVTYVMANKQSINTVKDLINALFKVSNSNYTAEDLFEFELFKPNEKENVLYSEMFCDYMEENYHEFDKMEWKNRNALMSKVYDEEMNKNPKSDWFQEILNYVELYYEQGDIFIKVKAKNETEDLKVVTGILSNLHNLFNYESSYDG